MRVHALRSQRPHKRLSLHAILAPAISTTFAMQQFRGWYTTTLLLYYRLLYPLLFSTYIAPTLTILPSYS